MNQALASCHIDDKWSYSCNSEFPNLEETDSCSSSGKCIDMKSCHNYLVTTYSPPSCTSADNKISIIKEIYRALTYADNLADSSSIRSQASNMKTSYETYLRSVKTALNDYTIKFQPFHAIFDNLIGNVLLNYLDDTLNKGFSALGIVFIINGFLMISLIIFTILLLSIIEQLDIKRNIEDKLKIKRYLGGKEAKDSVDDSLRG